MLSRLAAAIGRSPVALPLAPLIAVGHYYGRPSLRTPRGNGPLNGQDGRRRIVEALVADLGIERIVETGTFRASTELFRELAEVWSIEASRRNHWFARHRFRGASGVHRVHLLLGDSRMQLRELARRPELTNGRTLFYFDAHRGADLPLAEELQIAASGWSDWVGVIDDFRVPDDDGYGFDSYSEDATLDAAYLTRHGPDGLSVWYPRLPSAQENGSRRGCAVVTTLPEVAEQLAGLEGLLRPA